MNITTIFILFQPAGPHEDIPRRERIWRDFRSGLFLSAVLAVFWFLFGKTGPGEGIQRMTYQYLQRHLTPAGDPGVTLVDISELNLKDDITPRYGLQNLLEALRVQHPKAVGIDIDFSPNLSPENGYGQFIDHDDPRFFDYCKQLRLKDGIPVYLGIARTQGLPPQYWLGMPDYQELAAAIIASNDPKAAVMSIQMKGAKPAPGMGMALAAEAGAGADCPEPSGLTRFLIECSRTMSLGPVAVKESLIDFSAIRELEDRRIPISNDAFSSPAALQSIVSSHSAQIANHILLVGDVARKEDAFDSPVGTGSVPGVILHASEVYTLLTKPLFTIRETWRVLADFTLAELLLLVVLLARIASPPTLNHERLAVLVTWILILGVLVFGVNVDRHRVLWDDFLVVALALFLHQYAHRWSEKLTHWLHSPEMQAKESGD